MLEHYQVGHITNKLHILNYFLIHSTANVQLVIDMLVNIDA